MEITYQPWITVAGRNPSAAPDEPPIITQPLSEAIDLSGVRAGTVIVDLTDVEGGATLFLGVATSLTTGVVTLAAIDMANLPSRQSFSFQINGGEVSLANPESGTVSATAFGRYLTWFVIGPNTDNTAWSVSMRMSLRIQASVNSARVPRNTEIRTIPDIQPWVRLHADGVGFDNVEQAALNWVSTRLRSRLALDIDVPRLDNATMTIETSSTGDPLSWIDALTIEETGTHHILLTRDQGATTATTLRNFVRWRLHRVAESAFGAMVRVTGSGE